jgi:hypothetical protein
MRNKRLLLLSAILLLAAAASVQAGTVYVAPASNFTLNNVEFTTELQITNPTASNQSFTIHFIPSFTDGADRPENFEPTKVTIAARKTVVFRDGVVPAGQDGMLEISSDELVISARLVPSKGSSTGLGAPLPVVTSNTQRGSGNTQFLQGVSRTGNKFTSFGIVNTSTAVSQCTVDITSFGGGKLIPTAELSIQPLSHSYWRDVFGAVSLESVSDARIQVNCTRDSYPYALLMNTSSLAATAFLPVEGAGLSNFTPPGVATACPAGATCFDAPGLFHTPTFGNTTYRQTVNVPAGTYRQVKVTVDVRNGGWFSSLPDGIHNIFWLFNGDWRSTLGYINVRGPGKNVMTALTHAGMSSPDRPKAGLSMTPGQTYTLEWVYNASGRQISTILRSASGDVASSINQGAGRNVIASDGTFDLWVGNPDHRNEGYLEIPSIGWNYSNLHIEFIK